MSATLRCRAAHLGRTRPQAASRAQFHKISNDPDFVAKIEDIVGLYVDPPEKALVLSVDEKRSHGEWIATDALAE